jgi:DNA-binding MarR family transcriptional regulator
MMPPKPQHDYPDSIGRRLAFAVSAVNGLTATLLREHGLTPLQWVALCALWRRDGMTVSVLADYMKASVSATSRLLGRLEARRLIERRTVDSNRRILEVWLTEDAKKLDHLKDLYEEVNNLVLCDLSAEEREQFLSILGRISLTATRETERLKRSATQTPLPGLSSAKADAGGGRR